MKSWMCSQSLKGWLGAVLGCLLLVGCANVHTTQGGAIGLQRSQTMLLSSEEVEQASARAYMTEVNNARSDGALDTNPKLTNRVRKIANRLIEQAHIFRPDVARWKWEVHVQESDEKNAYAMAGGKIMVYSGLVTGLNLSDDELASIIGHEIAHVLREHSRESMSQDYAQKMGLSVVSALANLKQEHADLAGLLMDVALTKPHSRTMEYEADWIGLELMARAGYDPQAAIAVWKKMESMQGSGRIEFLSTHPSSGNRAKELAKRIETVMPLYEEAVSQRNQAAQSAAPKKRAARAKKRR